MSLDWSISNVRDYNAVNFNPLKPDEIHPVLNYLIFAMIPIGMSGITEKNKLKVFERVSIYQRMCGPAIKFGDGKQLFVTMEDIERYVGLSTNVSSETDAAFFKKVVRWTHDSWYKIDKTDNSPGMSAMEAIAARAERVAREEARKAMAEDAVAWCEANGVRLVEAQEDEVKGMWDWLDDKGNACDQSFATMQEAAQDAMKKLQEDPGGVYSVWRGDPQGGDYENVAYKDLTEWEQKLVVEGKLPACPATMKATWPKGA